MRILAFVAAVVVLVLFSFISFGAVLLAPMAVFALYRFRRAHGRELSAMASWFVACLSVAVACVAGGLFLFQSAPPGALAAARKSVDSASVAAPKRPPPEWLQRMAARSPNGGALSATPPVTFGPAMMILGGFFAVNFFSTFFGTVGWGCVVLLWYAAVRRKPWEPVPAPPEAILG